MSQASSSSQKAPLKHRVFELVKTIPAGKVAYYGQVAEALGIGARTVGWILGGITEEELSVVPWQRVVAKTGFISTMKLGYRGQIQKDLLIQDGVEVPIDHVDMEKYCVDSLPLDSQV
jgi:methylated-DNA-protein-cysteine methyltransferase-like protein